jgi:D-glycero-alpha-D-manno-heptose-7-phosphate kinase
VIITRTPLRITLGGGGTDLPSYYEKFGGFVLSAAVNRYIYIVINRTFSDEYLIKYSELERTKDVDSIEHPIVREALRLHPMERGIELVSVADIPAGTGLGSSGAFTVGVLRAIYAYRREHVTAANLAQEACAIEIDRLNRPVGKQDQYIAAFGGLTCMSFEPDGQVSVSPILVSNDTLQNLEEHLCMYFTGYSRAADSVLNDQKVRSEQGDAEMLANLHFVKENGQATKVALEHGDMSTFAALMHDHWQNKRKRSTSMSNTDIDRWYDKALDHGAIGGKLVGAGSGGFLLFYAKDQDMLRRAMVEEGLREIRFQFDHDGSSVVVRD